MTWFGHNRPSSKSQTKYRIQNILKTVNIKGLITNTAKTSNINTFTKISNIEELLDFKVTLQAASSAIPKCWHLFLLHYYHSLRLSIRTSDTVTVEYPSKQVNEVRESPKAAAQLHQYAEVSYGTSFFASTVMKPYCHRLNLSFPIRVINRSISLLLLIYLHVRFREGNHLWKSFRDMQVLHLIPTSVTNNNWWVQRIMRIQ